MIETVFRTADVAAPDRFDYWRACMLALMCPMEMKSEYDRAFRAESRLVRLGALTVWPGDMQPMHWERTPRLIRRSDPEYYHLSLPLVGAVAIEQEARQAVHGPWEMYVVDTSRPFECRVEGGRLTGVGLEVPKALVPLPVDRVGRLLAHALPARDGVGALLADFLIRVAHDSGSYRSEDIPRLEGVAVDLFTATLAHHLAAEDELSPEARRRALLLRVRSFVRQRLGDPELTPTTVAAAHHISTSHLHALFRNEELTVSAWIRQQRLQGARRDLADPARRTESVHRIAARWGFAHYAVFSRAFTAAYGVNPRDHRHQPEPPEPDPTR